MSANYNNSAWFYDLLSALVYGKALLKAQVYLLQFVPSNSKILIVGGGTGKILEEIAIIYPSGLKITYVEIAPKMMALSKKRNPGNNEVTYVNDAVENADLAGNFDVVITPFLFDNFTERNFLKIFNHIRQSLKPGGLWLNSDFQPTGKWWQKLMLRSMFILFRFICNIEANELPDIDKCFGDHEYRVKARQTFYGDFILSTAYQKPQKKA